MATGPSETWGPRSGGLGTGGGNGGRLPESSRPPQTAGLLPHLHGDLLWGADTPAPPTPPLQCRLQPASPGRPLSALLPPSHPAGPGGHTRWRHSPGQSAPSPPATCFPKVPEPLTLRLPALRASPPPPAHNARTLAALESPQHRRHRGAQALPRRPPRVCEACPGSQPPPHGVQMDKGSSRPLPWAACEQGPSQTSSTPGGPPQAVLSGSRLPGQREACRGRVTAL